jgi:hypothetical protein
MGVVVFEVSAFVVAELADARSGALLDKDPLEQPATLNSWNVPASFDENETLGVKVVPGLVTVMLALERVGAVASIA